jgi:uncharacterized membrane protein
VPESSRPERASWLRAALWCVAALAGLCVLWELVLAPIRPGGSWLALKALPAVLALPGLARGARRTGQWTSLALPFYFVEGVVRAWSETGRVQVLASGEAALALLAFVALMGWLRRD